MKRAPLSYYANMEVRGIITVVPYFDFQKDYFRWVCNQMYFFILHGFVVKLLFSHIFDSIRNITIIFQQYIIFNQNLPI